MLLEELGKVFNLFCYYDTMREWIIGRQLMMAATVSIFSIIKLKSHLYTGL